MSVSDLPSIDDLLAEERQRKINLIRWLCVLIVALGIPFLVRAALWQVETRIWSLSIAITVSIINAILVSRNNNTLLHGNIATAALFVAVGNGIYSSGGLYSPTMAWLPIMPLLGGVLSGYRSGMVWAGIALVTLFVFVGIDQSGMSIADQTPKQFLQAHAIAHKTATLLAVAGIMVIYQLQHQKWESKCQSIINALEKQSEQRLQAEQKAQQANAAKSQFLSNMSHELRTPLNSIRGFGQMLQKRVGQQLSPANLEALTILNRNSEHLLSLVNDLIDLARIEANAEMLSFEQVDCSQILSGCIKDLTPSADKYGLYIKLQCESQLLLTADQRRLQQVFLNLINNAIKYTQHGGVTVICRPEQHPNLGDCLQIDIRDTGVGIKAEDICRVFDKYNHIHSEIDRHVTSSGLGLALTKELIKLHQGSIEVDSSPGHGSTFTCWLPIGQNQLQDAA